MSDEAAPEGITDAMRRLRDMNRTTVGEGIARGWRLRIGCLACNRPKVLLRLEDLAEKHRHTLLKDLPLVCQPCKRARRKPWIGPAGYDTWADVVYKGED